MYFRLGDVDISIVSSPIVEDIAKRLREGASIVILGPHGVGKSIAIFSLAYSVAERGAVVIDLASDTSTFSEYIKLAKRAKWAFAIFDALPPQFYAEPEIWVEHAVLWRDNCSKIIARAEYIRQRGFPSAIVLPSELATRCRSELSRYEKVVVKPSLEVAREIFLQNSEVYCGDDYANVVVEKISEWGEGLGFMALYGAKSLQYCDEDPAAVVKEARRVYVERLKSFIKSVYAPTCSRGRVFVNVLANRHLPSPIVAQSIHYDVVESRVRTLEKLLALIDRVTGPHKEYVKILALQSAEELRRLMRPTWYIKALGTKLGELYKEALLKAAEEVRRLCGIALREINIRMLVKAYVIAYEAYDDLAKSIVALALGRSPCLGRMRRLCQRGVLNEAVVEAILNPYRLSIDVPPTVAGGLEYYAGRRAEEVEERSWIEVLNTLYEAAERARVDLRPFRDYVELALARGNLITKKLAIALVQSAAVVPAEVLATALKAAVEIGESVEELLERYIESVGDASLIYERCGAECRDILVEVAVASAAKKAKSSPCQAVRQLEIAVAGAGYEEVVRRYKPSEHCIQPI